jgi:hypothetical protein
MKQKTITFLSLQINGHFILTWKATKLKECRQTHKSKEKEKKKKRKIKKIKER